jgi:hypothetical protein
MTTQAIPQDIDTSLVTTLAGVIARLRSLDGQLKQSKLEQVRYFNSAYLVISEAVADRLGSGYFENDSLVERLDVRFMEYYVAALRDYVGGRPATPAWQRLFTYAPDGSGSRMCYLALGVNAHVNNDLGMCLNDVGADANFEKDFLRVNALIDQSRDIVAQRCGIMTPYHPVVKLGMRIMIRSWRLHAWRVMKRLNRTQSRPQVEAAADEVAYQLQRLPWPV